MSCHPKLASYQSDRVMSSLKPLGAVAEFTMGPIYCLMQSSWDSLRRSRISSLILTLYDRQLDVRRPVFWEEGCIKLVLMVSTDRFYDCASLCDSIDSSHSWRRSSSKCSSHPSLGLSLPPADILHLLTTFRHHFMGQRGQGCLSVPCAMLAKHSSRPGEDAREKRPCWREIYLERNIIALQESLQRPSAPIGMLLVLLGPIAS